jgi:serine/threonine protein kinase
MNEENLYLAAKITKMSLNTASQAAGDDLNSSVEDKKTYYEFQELLGEGAFCKVFKALYKPTGEEVAVKVKL